MPLNLLSVSTQVREMGELLVARYSQEELRIKAAREVLADQRDNWEELAQTAELARERVAVPTGPLDERLPAPPRPAAYTALATDGSEIDPDRHGATGNFFLVNIGSALIPYGQPGRDARLRSDSHVGFTEEELFIVDPRNPRRQVPVRDRHLDALRTVAELRALANLAESEVAQHGDVPIVALVDGTLLFSVLEERPQDFLRAYFYGAYVAELDRLRAAGAALAAYASRARGIDLVNLFRARCGVEPASCATCAGLFASRQRLHGEPSGRASEKQPDVVVPPTSSAGRPEEDAPRDTGTHLAQGAPGAPECVFRGLTDANLLGPDLHEGDRSALFRVRSNVHDPYYGEHRMFFFMLDTGAEIARVEVPEWVASDRARLASVHAALVDQVEKGQGYPAVLARADDRAVVSTGDRQTLDLLVRQELARRGVRARPSAKLGRKQLRTV